MSDIMLRVLIKEEGVRALACITTETVREAGRRLDATPLATACLAHGFTAVALLGGLLKVQHRVALRVQSNGPLQKLIAESDAYGHLRGYVAVPNLESPTVVTPDDVAAAFGDLGLLTVNKDVQLKELAESVVPLQSADLDVNLTYFLNTSEQVPSIVEIGVVLDQDNQLALAGGILLQTLPGEPASTLLQFAERMDDLPPLGQLLADGQTLEQVLATLFAGMDYDILERQELSFRCGCSQERSAAALKMLGRVELEELVAHGEAVVDCHFCHQRYVFDRQALEGLLAETGG